MNEATELLHTAIGQALRGVHTCMPGRILSYTPGSQKASIQPLLNRRLRDGVEEKLPVLNDVPVLWPQSGGASMTFPVNSGDGCLLLFCDRSLDEWKSQGGEVFPDDPRAHDLSDAVAIMGFNPFNQVAGSENGVVIKMGGSTFNLDGGAVTIDTPSVTVNAPNITMAGNVSVSGNLTVDGGGESSGAVNITAGELLHNGVNIGNTHVHGGITPGGGTTDGPQ